MKKSLAKWFTGMMIGTLLLTTAGCGGGSAPAANSASQGGEAAKIGVVAYMSGGGAAYGQAQKEGLELAKDEINALGKVKIELVYEDSRGDKTEAINAANKLINKDNVVGIIGPTLSGEMFAVGPIAHQSGVPIMGTSTTAEGITDIGEFVFRNALPESSAVPQAVKMAVQKYNLKKVALMYSSNNDWAVSGYKTMEQALKDNGVEVLATETFADKDTDFSAQLTKISSLKPDAVMVSSLYQEAALVLRKARETGINVPFVGTNGFNSPELIKIAGKAAEGAIVASPWYPGKENEKIKKFVADYKAKNNKVPDQFAAQAYDALYIYASALEKAGSSTDRTKLRDSLATIKDFQGVTGKFAFDDKRNPLMDATVLIVKDGQFTELK
ncbi:branched-chain amino acid ABC transporter substrate-binding protein [Desulfosporosinus fructosivorans]|uniref:Branched-chain amino acid ABC transporter substrate-binding protein n=1 Tax=Desulfosporosinus fructosivorans TaxID=2018669 RepID=A0A4Z0RBV7_9FIRM|nr:ABC transporter substrate-binding protein [Desulfosporosinus fructosivorans]TGE39473.1 branched-chain amino acid ABC transporter substrate-binding protein [Desulfosporosinus fructosivorans]